MSNQLDKDQCYETALYFSYSGLASVYTAKNLPVDRTLWSVVKVRSQQLILCNWVLKKVLVEGWGSWNMTNLESGFGADVTKNKHIWVAWLAQSVEHQTFNLRVMGSSPISGGTSTFFFLAQSSLLAQGMIAAGFRRAKTTWGRTDDVVVKKYRRPEENSLKLTRQNSTEKSLSSDAFRLALSLVIIFCRTDA